MAKSDKGEKSLESVLAAAISEAETFSDGTLATEREEALRYYRGELPKPMHSGDSRYVSRDVFEAVDSMRSTILESFSASSRIVFFRPEQGEAKETADEATDYCRHVFFKDNAGEDIMYEALTEGLTKRFAVAKVAYEESFEEDEFEFDGLTIEELTMAVGEHDNFEFLDTEESENGLLSGSYSVTKDNSRILVEVVQPEDLFVSSGTSSLKDAHYIIHRYTKTKSDLLSMGIDGDVVEELQFSEDADWDNFEKYVRDEPLGTPSKAKVTEADEVLIYEIYINVDREGTGRTKLWKFLYCQSTILSEERVACMPFASFVPMPTPHTFHGENFAHSVIPIQNARTVLIRQVINHTLITNNPRTQVLNGTITNPSELLDNRLGGIVNVRRMDGIAPIPQSQMNPYVFNMINMIADSKEEATGVSRLSQGLNKDAISSQNAEGMVEQLISASQQRQKIIARRFGTFLREIWHLIYSTAIDHVDEAEFVSITGKHTPVSPVEWKKRTVASIELSLGYGEAQREAQKWAELDQYFSQDPMLAPAYSYEKRYEVLTRGLEKRGIEDITNILTPPDQMQPPEPSQQEQMQMKQMEMQLQYLQAQAQSMIMKAESDRMKAEAELLRAQTDAQFRQATSQIGAERLGLEKFVALEEIELARNADTQSANYNPDI